MPIASNSAHCANNSKGPLIQVERFRKTYGSTVAVADFSFQVQPGEILGVVGPNGAGKTTTMRSLAALIQPTSGRLTVCGLDVTKDPVGIKQSLAYLPDDPHLFPDLTVEEHLAFIASAFRVENARAKSDRLLEEFELTNKRRSRTRDLSRGMRQKLAICCAYLHDPKAILFDEPLTGLDPHGIRSLKSSIRERANTGTAVLVSSHLLAMVEDLCTHILILHAGEQRFFGTLAELKRQFFKQEQDATLERIFFLATGTESEPAELVATTP
jgi:ABC-2 type transport system ATP-binding protein